MKVQGNSVTWLEFPDKINGSTGKKVFRAMSGLIGRVNRRFCPLVKVKVEIEESGLTEILRLARSPALK
jgi:hypothetical protein